MGGDVQNSTSAAGLVILLPPCRRPPNRKGRANRRSWAAQGAQVRCDQPQLTDPGMLKEFQAAQNQLSTLRPASCSPLGSIDLKSIRTSLHSVAAEGTENRIATVARARLRIRRCGSYNTELKELSLACYGCNLLPFNKPLAGVRH